MNPITGYNMTPEYVITRKVNNELLMSLRQAVIALTALGKEFSANDVMTEVTAIEAAAAEGETPTYGGYDTDVIRTWYTLFGALNTFLAATFTISLRDGTNENITPEKAVLRYYSEAN